METAVAHGFLPGSQLPDTVYVEPLHFADQDWRRPDRATYMAALARYRPAMATVLDWERDDQLSDVLDWAEEAAQHAERVVVIPKVMGGVPRLPRRVGGRDVVLGYSVPTRFAGTELPLWEFAGWPVHLLGGSPHVQMRVWAHLAAVADVASADGNFAQKMATRWCASWSPVNLGGRHPRWPTLAEQDGRRWDDGGPQEAFRRSCVAIAAAWDRLTG
jgi:hypothetical protein